MLASSADDLRVWDGDNFDNLIKHYNPNVQKISSLAWNSSNTQIASTSPGGCAIDVAYLDSDTEPYGYPIIDEAICLCWHSSSKFIGLGCADGQVKVYDLKNQSSKKVYTGHKAPVTCVTYNYNDTSIASASKSGEIFLHNTVTDLTTKLMTTLKLQAIQGLQYSLHHHSMLASVSDDASLVLWDTSARRSIHQFTRSHKAPATDLTFSPSNDRLLMSCGLDKNIVLYDVLNKSLVRTLQVDTPLSAISMHPNGYQVATGTIKGQILLHDLRHGSKVQHTFTAHRSSVQCLAFLNRIIPKKSKSSMASASSNSPNNSMNSQMKLKETSQTPLKTVDQNAINVITDETPHKTPTVKAAVIEKPSTPCVNGEAVRSTASASSIFSPDVGVDNSPFSRPLHSTVSSLNGSAKYSGGSVFSPDVGTEPPSSHPTPSIVSTFHNSTSSNHFQNTPTTSTRGINNTPVTRRELPLPPSSLALSTGRGVSPKLPSPPASQKPASAAVHFTPAEQARDSMGAAAGMMGAGDVVDALPQRLKNDLKQELKSELLGEIKDLIDLMKDDIKQSMMDHHFEMIKQFYLMQVHVESQTSQHSINFDLLRENEELKAEIERLKRTY